MNPNPAEPPLAEGLESGETTRPAGGSFLGRLLGSVRGRVTSNAIFPEADYAVLGFIGLWFMAGEAHVTSIAVDEFARGRGIGELLLMGSIELAISQRATAVSLEARVSNYAAQSLYEKYGFQNVGIRKGYYTDNREDAWYHDYRPHQQPRLPGEVLGSEEGVHGAARRVQGVPGVRT